MGRMRDRVVSKVEKTGKKRNGMIVLVIGELYVSAVQVAVITFIRIANMVRDVRVMGVDSLLLLDRIAFFACALACVTTNHRTSTIIAEFVPPCPSKASDHARRWIRESTRNRPG